MAKQSSSVKAVAQKFIVRTIASELDRRSRALEKALADTNAQLVSLGSAQQTLSAQIEANHDYVSRVHDHVKNVEAAHNRLVAQHATTVARLDTSGPEHAAMKRDLEAVVGEFAGLREAVARVDALMERRP